MRAKVIGALVLTASAFGVSSAHATLTIRAASKGSVVVASGNNLTGYYVSGTTAPSGAFFDPDPTNTYRYGPVDLTAYQETNGASPSEALFFEIVTDKAISLAAGETLVLSITAKDAGGTVRYMPIANVGGGTNCNTRGQPSNSLCYGGGQPDVVGGINYSYAVAAQGTGTRFIVGIYPKDWCTAMYKQTASLPIAGCTDDSTDADPTHLTMLASQIGAAAAAFVPVTFQLNAVDAAGVFTTTAVQDSAILNLRFQEDASTASCPDVSNLYEPGDSTIFINTGGFPTSLGLERAPWQSAIVVANKGAAPDVTQAFTGNSIVARVGFGNRQKITGFENITAADDAAHTYGLNVLLRDAAGLVSVPNCSTNLPLSGVQTASVQGFLSKSSCFIATAAFRSIDAAPVALLRKFRDEILLTHSIGRAFVQWYYDWSPRAAEWLMEHPEYRYPVLQALIPVELVAWLMLHPVQLSLLVVFTLSAALLSGLFWLALRARRELR